MAHFRLKKGFTPLEVDVAITSGGKWRKPLTGFTLIELLVVVAIIGLLSSIVIASLASAKQKARDVVRKSDLHQLRTALELGHIQLEAYPAASCSLSGGIDSSNCNSSGGNWNDGQQYQLYQVLVVGGKYMSSLPLDPLKVAAGNINPQVYLYRPLPSDCDNSAIKCSSFILQAKLEAEKDILGEGRCWRDDLEITGVADSCITTP